MLKGSKGSFLSFSQIIPQYDGIPEVPQQQSSQVPQLIWSLWDTGIENAPTMQSTCLWSQRAANPSFEARQLDLQSAINMTNVLSLISKDSWDNMTIQAKSDVIRVVLLHKYGGVWADATLCMVEETLSIRNIQSSGNRALTNAVVNGLIVQPIFAVESSHFPSPGATLF